MLAAIDEVPDETRVLPSVRVGSGIHLDDQLSADQADLVLGAFFQVQHVGVDLLRFETNFGPPGDEELPLLTLEPPSELKTWMAVARQDVAPRISVHGDLRGIGTDPIPRLARGGVSSGLRGAERMLLVANVTHGFDPQPGAPGGEWRIDLGVHSRLAWRLPQEEGHWNLGQVDGTRPSWAPDPDRGEPNELTTLVAPPADRYGEPASSSLVATDGSVEPVRTLRSPSP
jgi:hypothetical protein